MKIIKGAGGAKDLGARAAGMFKKARGSVGATLVWFVLAAIISIVLLFGSFETIEPGQVAVEGWNLPADTRLAVAPFGGDAKGFELEPLADDRISSEARLGLGVVEALSLDGSQ